MATSLQNEIFVILNPMARGERARALRKNLDHLSAHAIIKLTSAAGDATQMARRAADQGFRTIVAAGGDGTINEVINGLALSKARLGILPLGTVNVLARELGIPLRIDRAWELIVQGHSRTIDLARANDKYFVQLAGVGLDAQTIRETTFGFKKIWGPLSYVLNAARIASYAPPRVYVETGGQTHEGCFVLVGNGRYYGGSFPFFREAALDDGLLDVCIFKSQKHLDLIRYFQAVLIGRLKYLRDVTYLKVPEVRISAQSEVPVEVDGEFSGSLPATFRIEPAALQVIVPKP
ncbi:MAG: diacylglycerol kinase family lipid kinase [Verrucomicrobiae bacterium]|nr:diacylglycerol kinase family lipid kinase [Verrucomicrobiae bacterium]